MMKNASFVAAASLMLAALATPVMAANQETEAAQGVMLKMKGITLNIGGFIEGDLIYRSRNLNSDLASPFQSLPLANAPGYYQNETRLTARHSRLSFLVRGDYGSAVHIAGYYEMDFMGAAPTANSNESNSYNPRTRHLYATIDWDRGGMHFLGGQTWSLVTMNEKGIVPRTELIPPTIDIQYVPGLTWARQPQFRVVKDWDSKYWLGLSVENPQTTVKGGPNPPLAANYANGQPPGNNFANPVSVNSYPDFVVKAAADPGWGHYEIYDLIRVFETGLAQDGRLKNTYTATNAVGGAAILPLVPKKLKAILSGIYGEGIGRYGSASLPDVTLNEFGENIPLKGSHFLAGLIWDPTADWSLYTFYGQERLQKRSWSDPVTGKGYGYGSELYNNSGASTLGGTVNGHVKKVSQVTAGAWWKFYQGDFGKMQTGLQYSYTEDEYFTVIDGGGPTANDHMVFAGLRYYWQ